MSFIKKFFHKKGSDYQTDIRAAASGAGAPDAEFLPPLAGRIVPITEVPDPVFSQKIMGDGFAVIPQSDMVRSPVDGQVIHIFPTRHAIALRSSGGRELLIHIGLNTVSLKGEGFTMLVKEGERVKKGERLLKADFSLIAKRVPSTITSVVFTNLKKGEKVVIQGSRISIKNDH
ncbi:MULTISPECIES: PTS sugar transporter subunit IIA [unclassified Sporolactobacillus]|uniref:PTS sugar transporter subunit IIA n=1 Tax=unclassified Sporolactobacillus TaxID=2628533 RepID=UPI002367DECA|nr:PTS glucose transporter subunit IIA [Sporolactobacillus sp. CQH2019]MDD9148373.1 PTS glucose transporter subunit IIA [Sporolactobacillus sp. CQH2019]